MVFGDTAAARGVKNSGTVWHLSIGLHHSLLSLPTRGLYFLWSLCLPVAYQLHVTKSRVAETDVVCLPGS